jgi:hypothetical protein
VWKKRINRKWELCPQSFFHISLTMAPAAPSLGHWALITQKEGQADQGSLKQLETYKSFLFCVQKANESSTLVNSEKSGIL